MQRQSFWFFWGLNAPAFSLALIHVINKNLYHYVLTRFTDTGLLDPDRLNTALGTLGILGMLIASLVQPTVGFLSDRTHTRLGARYPYFISGAVLTTVALLLMVNAQAWAMLILALVMVQVALNSVQSPLQALIPDQVVPNRMGVAASIKTVLELIGIVASGMIVWLLLGTKTRPELAVLVCAVIFFSSIAVSMVSAPPQPNQKNRTRWHLKLPPFKRVWANLSRLLSQREFMWWLVSRFLFYSSFNSIGQFSVTYLMDVYGYSGDEARAIQGKVLVATGIMIFITTIGAGFLSDRVGRRPVAAAGGVLAAAASLTLIQSPGLTIAAILIGITGIGCSIFLSSGWALITALVPEREAGFYLGLANVATTIGGAFGLLNGYVVDWVNDDASTPVAGYNVLFGITTACFMLGALAILNVQESKSYSPPQTL